MPTSLWLEQLVDMARLAENMELPGKKVMSTDSVKGGGIIASDPVKGGNNYTQYQSDRFQTKVNLHHLSVQLFLSHDVNL